MLSTVFTLAAIALGLTATTYIGFVASAEARPRASAVVDYARLTTAIVSLLLFALTPIVLWLRRVPPPRAITAFVLATATCGLGWALLGDGSASEPSPRSSEFDSAPP